VDPAFRTLIAPDTKLLAGVEWDALKSSPFYQRHRNNLNVPAFDAETERIGINPVRDVSKLLVEWNGADWLFMERGRFNGADLQKKLIADGASETTYRGRTLLGNNSGSLVFFKSLALEGSTTAARRAIDLEGAGDGEIPEDLAERLRTLDSRDQVWAVSRGGLAFANVPMNSDTQTALSNITGFITGTTAGLYCDTGVHLAVDLQCVSGQGATRVHDALRGLVGFGRLSTKDNDEDLLRAYDAVHIDQAGQIVKVRADLSSELADKLVILLTSISRRR
jgi:hypothetical protein